MPQEISRLMVLPIALLMAACAAPAPPPPTAGPAPTEEPAAAQEPAPTDQPTATAEPYVSPRGTAEVVPAPRIVGYFSSWGIYARSYHVKTMVTSGAAERLDAINYAFAAPINNHCGLGDTNADAKRVYGPADSVNGQGNAHDDLRGHFSQLRLLKEAYPDVKVLIAIGGWTLSAGFSDAALPENREAFVASCIDMFIRGNLPGFETPGVAAGVFDGIDIDWEYPAAPARRGHEYRPEDTQNFTALLAEFRRQLDEIDPDLLLTIAAPAGEGMYSLMELDRIHPYLDWINIMAYDFHGAWDAEGPTNFLAPLYGSPDNPPEEEGLYADYAVQAFLAAGAPPQKINLGVPFYGRGWTGVADANNGLYQPATGPAAGAFEPGINDYNVLRTLDYPGFHDPQTGAYWIFDGVTFWTFDDPQSIAAKAAYVRELGLGGIMIWELAGDTRDGELITAIDEGLRGEE